MDISLRDITKDNWLDMIDLDISKEQEKYVALPAEAIAASKFHEHYVNRGVYLEEEPVGFIQYHPNFNENMPDDVFLDQLIIDQGFQGRGYGTKAFALAVDEIRSMPGINSISVCYVDGHSIMRRFFSRFGFNVVEQQEYEETIMRLHFSR